MSIRKAVMTGIVAISMVAVPTIAQAATANQSAVSKLSIRSGAKVAAGRESHVANGLLGLLALIVIGGGVGIALGSKGTSTSK